MKTETGAEYNEKKSKRRRNERSEQNEMNKICGNFSPHMDDNLKTWIYATVTR